MKREGSKNNREGRDQEDEKRVKKKPVTVVIHHTKLLFLAAMVLSINLVQPH